MKDETKNEVTDEMVQDAKKCSHFPDCLGCSMPTRATPFGCVEYLAQRNEKTILEYAEGEKK